MLASVAGTLAPLPSTPPDAPSPADDEGTALPPPNLNSIRHDAPAPARVSVLDGAAGDAARPVTPTDAIDVAAPFREPPPRATKKRKRNRQSDDEKMDSVFAAAEGVRAVAKLVLAAAKPVAASADPLLCQAAECLEYSAERLNSCASTLEAACANTEVRGSRDDCRRRDKPQREQ